MLVVLPLVLPQVLALALGLYHPSWFLGVQALASPLSSVIPRCVFLTQRLGSCTALLSKVFLDLLV